MLFAAVLAIGCRKAEPAPQTTPAPSPEFHAISTDGPAPAGAPASDDRGDPRPLILCFGDSLTAGYGTDPGQSFPDYLQQRLDAAGYHYHVVNEGVSGNTTKDGVERLPHIVARHAKIVVLEFGGNDGLRGLPLEATQQNMATMIEGLQKGGATVVLAGITLPPDYGPDYIHRFNAMYPTLAKKYHTRLLPFLLDKVWGVPGDMQGDATHATAQGNKQVAANVQGLIQPLLTK
ncbi:acyl-CoA thioesterase-1 [Bryocella elongata]|uniref:Acyl-CoA thioesterase-1 n=1 Tax=Bryocella elongata TaxID=863522 RepID=A0A1H5U978_9BACT|nr:arylesterase [Bryocella elongata]SEF71672.1 acyl-CoA thioesterase-1 [Bryocella elongata]